MITLQYQKEIWPSQNILNLLKFKDLTVWLLYCCVTLFPMGRFFLGHKNPISKIGPCRIYLFQCRGVTRGDPAKPMDLPKFCQSLSGSLLSANFIATLFVMN